MKTTIALKLDGEEVLISVWDITNAVELFDTALEDGLTPPQAAEVIALVNDGCFETIH